jgi:hypothetical protein
MRRLHLPRDLVVALLCGLAMKTLNAYAVTFVTTTGREQTLPVAAKTGTAAKK